MNELSNQELEIKPDRRMRIGKGRFFIIVAAAFVAGIVLSVGAMAGVTSMLRGGGTDIDEAKLGQIDRYIDKYYLNSDEVDRKELVDNAYRGYVAGLGDPYSAYMTKDEFDSYMVQTSGSYGGIGVTFEQDDKGNYRIVSVSPESPAEKAGLEAGDYILECDGKFYTSSDVMAARIRGKKGTQVELKISRDGEEKTLKITRDKIVQKSVEHEMKDGDIGYIRINSFIETTGSDFDEALSAVEKKGAKKLILDLRDNGGGLVDDAISVADQFLDAGVACYVQDKEGNTEEYTVRDGKTDLDTVILVNGNSASASEILAGALKDNGYRIVGEKTFGKGIIQTNFNLPEGDSLKLTILEYLTPDKHHVQKKGIKPSVKVKDDKDTEADEQLEKAEELLK